MTNPSETPFDADHAAPPRRRGVKVAVVVGIVTLLVVVLAYWISPRGGLGRKVGSKQTAAAMQAILAHAQGYAVDFENRFPPHLASLVLRGLRTTTLVDTAGGTVPLPQPGMGPPESWEKLAPAVDAHCDFVYVGQGVKVTDPPGIIVLYTRPGRVPEGRMVGFLDGRAELVRERDLPGIFEQNNALRRDAGRPVITLDSTQRAK